MRNFCIFCGQKLVGGACACADFRAYYGYGENPADAVFSSTPGREVIETPVSEARYEEAPVAPVAPVAPAAPAPTMPEIPDAGPTVYYGGEMPGAAPAAPAPAAPVTPVAPVAPAPKVEKASVDSHFRSAGDL